MMKISGVVIGCLLLAGPAFAGEALYAKLDGSTFFYYDDIACTNAVPAPETGLADVHVLFANDTEYQALLPFAEDIQRSKGLLLQSDLTLTADADWRAIDFDMNGKTIRLMGWDLQVRRPTNGRFTAGNLINPLSASGNGSATWSGGGGWWNVGTKSYQNALWWNFTAPRTRNVVFALKTKKYSGGYLQYVYAALGGTVYMNYSRTDNQGTRWWGPWVKSLTAGQSVQVLFRRNNGYAYVGMVTVSPESHLTIDVPAGEEFDTAEAKLDFGGPSANEYERSLGLGLQIHKTGPGRLLLSKAWTSDSTAKGVTQVVVKEGVAVRSAAAATCGCNYATIAVEEGAQFDLNGRTYHDYSYTLAGSGPDGTGALVSRCELDPETAAAQNTGVSFLENVTLATNATIYAAENMGLIFYNYGARTMTMNGHTVTFDAADGKRLFAGAMSYSGAGRIVVASNGWFQTQGANVSAANVDVEVNGRWWQNGAVMTPVKSLTFREGSTFRELSTTPPTITVYDSYAPNWQHESDYGFRVNPTVKLGDASHLTPTLDLSRWTAPFDDLDGTISFVEGSTVTIALGARRKSLYGYLYRWKDKPADTVAFTVTGDAVTRVTRLIVDDKGIRLHEAGLRLIIR
jgi:hypothetical protein